MKIIGASGKCAILIEISPEELAIVTNWRNPFTPRWEAHLQDLGPRTIDLAKEFGQARELLDSFRGIAPALKQSAARLEKLASEVEIHEPDVSLLPKKEG